MAFPRGDYERTGVKRCPECGETKPLSEYHRPPSWKGRPQTYCKPCALARNKKWREANRERRREYQKDRQLEQYGIGLYDYNVLLEAQGGVCAICKGHPKDRALDVDHCHQRNEVRGLLCSGCNRILGLASDDVERLRAIIEYVLKWRETHDSPLSGEVVSA